MFYLTCVCLLLELIVLNLKPNFLTLLMYSLVLYWLFLGYYDRFFVNYLIYGLAVSVVFDIIYGLLMLLDKLHNNRPSTGAFSVFVGLFIIIQLALRVVIMAKLFKWRDLPTKPEFFEVHG